MGRKSIYTAVIGCGMISDIYLKNMTERFENLEVVACCDLDPEKAAGKAEAYHIRSCSLEEIMGDTGVELVVVLTPVPTHYALIRKALEAG
jgi:predicted dehydrogenase